MDDLDLPADELVGGLDRAFDELFADELACLDPTEALDAAIAPGPTVAGVTIAGEAIAPGSPGGRLQELKALLRRIDVDARAAAAAAAATTLQPRYLRCTIGGLPFALPLETLAEVALVPRVVPVPHVRPWVLGVVNVRGHVLALLDLRTLLGWPTPPAPTDRMLVGRRRGGEPLGAFVVDGVQGIRTYPPERVRFLEGSEGAPHGIVGTCDEDVGGEVMVLDVERLLATDECERFDAA